ncbi:MAG: zinc ribbon domain-containing protein [Chloroflexi bacterium]|nr:zinc ribbon domain-containing protein [Chloroflexota bacterium]
MPLYEYQCQVCGKRFEVRQPVGEDSATCPAGHGQVRRVFSTPLIVFKGSGFYVTDQGKGGKDQGKGETAAD